MGSCHSRPEPSTTLPPNRPVNHSTTRPAFPSQPQNRVESLDLTAEGVARVFGRPEAAPAPIFQPQAPYKAHFLNKPTLTATDNGPIILQRCRWCLDHFEYRCSDGRVVNIVYGIPRVHEYKAASYVWGVTKPLPFQCASCRKSFTIPMRDHQKFLDLMSLAADRDWMWIDAISIDQTDPNDIADKLARMGDIYRNSKQVSVLLPPEDEDAMRMLSSLAIFAANITGSNADLSNNREPRDCQVQYLTQACQQFLAGIENLKRSLNAFTYWTRAWKVTFQEFAMAPDIEMTCEGGRVDVILQGLKTLILQSATVLAVYKLLRAQYANIDLGCSRGQMVQKFEIVKQLLPCETAFNSPDAETGGSEETDFEAMMPHIGFGRILGLRCSQPGNPFDANRNLLSLFRLDMPVKRQINDQASQLRERLGSALNALSVGRRQAKFPADLVASWASMCNISYQYDKNDGFPAALVKVLDVLRQQYGIRVFNFHPDAFLETSFFDYSSLHHQSNSYDGMNYYPGTPIFTGRVDTVKHAVISAINHGARSSGTSNGETQNVRIVRNAELIYDDYILGRSSHWLDEFSTLAIGQYDEFTLKDIAPLVRSAIDEISPAVDQRLELVRAHCRLQISTQGLPTDSDQWVTMWAIVSEMSQSESRCVAREEINGQLVVLRRSPVCRSWHIEAYLTVTDQQSGTHVVRCGDQGVVDIRLQSPVRSDVGNADLQKLRFLRGRFDLADNTIVVDG